MSNDRKKHDGALPDDEDWTDLGPVSFADPRDEILPALPEDQTSLEPGVYGPATLRMLQEIAYADIGQYMSWGPRGVVVKDSEDLTPEQRRLVAEVSEDKDGVIKLKLCSKDAALRLLGQASGVLKENPGSFGSVADLVEVLRAIDGRSRGLPPKTIEHEPVKKKTNGNGNGRHR